MFSRGFLWFVMVSLEDSLVSLMVGSSLIGAPPQQGISGGLRVGKSGLGNILPQLGWFSHVLRDTIGCVWVVYDRLRVGESNN